MFNKKGVAPLMILLVVGSIALALSYGVVNLGSIGIGDTFAKPSFARLECAPTDGYEGSFTSSIKDTLFKCDANTQECIFTLRYVGAVYVHSCNLDGSSCLELSREYSTTEKTTSFTISSGRAIKLTSPLGLGSGIGNLKWKSWKLYRYVGGAKYIVNSVDCSLTSCYDRGDSCTSKIEANDKRDKLLRQGAEGTKWINYVNDWNYGPATGIVTYNGQQAYCTGAKIYSIVKLQMANGNLVKIDPTYQGKTESGEVISGLGNVIANVECCPNEPNCGNDFKYKQIATQEKECFSDLQCFNANGPVPISDYYYVKYSCQNNKCIKSEPVQVECTTNAQCTGGKICDLSTTNYGKCISQISTYCGDGVCQLGETFNICPQDCALNCPPDQKLITKTTFVGRFCWLGIGCQEKREQYCGTEMDWMTIIFWILILVAFLVLFYYGLPYIRPFFKSIIGFVRGFF